MLSTRTKICNPALKHLHINCFGEANPKLWLADVINKTSPGLTHLRLSAKYAIGAPDEMVELAPNAADPLSHSTAFPKLPPTVRMISFQAPYMHCSPLIL
jgi:hypothetical protein